MTVSFDPKKVRARIKRYENHIRKRNYRDGSGSRFLIGPLYLLLDDTQGAVAHYRWFEKKYQDDAGEPFHRISWALAILRKGHPDKAVNRLRYAHTQNAYMIPAILGIPHGQPSIDRSSNWEYEEYILNGPQEFLTMWRPEEKAWMKSVWDSPEFKAFVQTHLDLVSQLARESVGPKRTELVNALSSLPLTS